MKVYFGNLPRDIDDAKLGEIVKPYGAATSAEVVKDRVTGASKGFAFVEFATNEEAQATITALNGTLQAQQNTKHPNGSALLPGSIKTRNVIKRAKSIDTGPPANKAK